MYTVGVKIKLKKIEPVYVPGNEVKTARVRKNFMLNGFKFG